MSTEATANQPTQPKPEYHISLVNNGLLADTIYRDGHYAYLVKRDDRIDEVPSIEIGERIIQPFDVRAYIDAKMLFLPSEVTEYGSQARLVRDIAKWLHKYVDIPEFWEQLIAHYVLMTWVYDRFTALPYLRFMGEPGTGKTQIQKVAGSLCYKATFASGSISGAGIFRLCDLMRGTLILDEADYSKGDDGSDIMKALNLGYSDGAPVQRCSGDEYKPTPYKVYGPKILTTRHSFGTEATESRCLTLQTTRLGCKLRKDIPFQLPTTFEIEACLLRNKLLKWRFDNFASITCDESKLRELEPRLGQIGAPIYSVSKDAEFQKEFVDYLTRYDKNEKLERPAALVIRELLKLRESNPLFVNTVTVEVNLRAESQGLEPMKPKTVGAILRSQGFKTRRMDCGYCIIPNKVLFDSLAKEYADG